MDPLNTRGEVRASMVIVNMSDCHEIHPSLML